jgi:cytochrome b561
MTNTNDHYSPVAKTFHWVSALCILAVLPLGWVLDKLPDGPLQSQLFDLHRSLGVLILALGAMRLAARHIWGAPAPYSELTRFERISSIAVHHTLYLLLIITPLIGWAMMSAYRAEVPVFGLFNLMPILPENRHVYEILSPIHHVLAYGMAVLILLHAGGGLAHHFIKRDGVLMRMWPRF